jgi:hypothetical protein
MPLTKPELTSGRPPFILGFHSRNGVWLVLRHRIKVAGPNRRRNLPLILYVVGVIYFLIPLTLGANRDKARTWVVTSAR